MEKSTLDRRSSSITLDPFEQLPPPEDLSGQVKILSYRPVFNGPYSCIYRGKLRRDGQLVAIKVLNAVKGAALHTMRRKLERERRTWGVLNHPNILPLYGFANEEELFQPFGALISPWLRRGDAAEFLAEYGGSMTTEQRIELWRDVVAGVDYLHSYKPLLIHGDLKPRNVLIDDSGRAQICDFGLVRIFLEGGSSGMTTTTHHTGTERYLAYELVMAGEDARPTTSSDIYAAGCIGLEFIFARIPYAKRKNNSGGMIFLDIRAKIPPSKHPSGLSSHLELMWAALENCWDMSPEHRPSAEELLGWLDEQMASRMLETTSNEIKAREPPENVIRWGKVEHGALDPNETAQMEESPGFIPNDSPQETRTTDHVRSTGSAALSMRARSASQGSRSTSQSSSSGHLPSIHSLLGEEPEVASVRSIPSASSSLRRRDRIPFFDNMVASPEEIPGSLPAFPIKRSESSQAVKNEAQGGKKDYGHGASGRSYARKDSPIGEKAALAPLMRQGSGSSNRDGKISMEELNMPMGVAAEEPLRVAILWYLHVHDPNQRFRWIKCNSILFPSHLQLIWVEAGGGKAIVRLDLLSCTEVRSIPSPSHTDAWKDIGNVTARAQALDDAGGVAGIDELCPFKMLYADGVERLGAGSPRERSKWMDTIRRALNRVTSQNSSPSEM